MDKSTSAPLNVCDLLPFGYVCLEGDGQVCQANLAAAALLGTERDRLLNSPFFGFFPPGSEEVLRGYAGQVSQTGREPVCKTTLRQTDGTSICVILKSLVTTDGTGEAGRLEIGMLPAGSQQSGDGPPGSETPPEVDLSVHPLPGPLPGITWTVTSRDFSGQMPTTPPVTLPAGMQARSARGKLLAGPEFPPWAAHRRALAGRATGYEIFSEDISFFSYVEPIRNRAGQTVGAAGMAYDATPLKQMGTRLRFLSGRIIQIQEQERLSFARELHDQIGQMLAVLGLAIGQARNSPPGRESEGLKEAQSLVKDLAAQVHKMSLDLRSDMLEDLGLLATLISYLNRYAEQTHVKVDFKHSGLDATIPLDVAAAAYRIVQEALTNVARHASVPEAVLRIWADSESLYLQVEDRGKGFNPAECGGGDLTGLRGMRERAEWLGGRLTIESAPGRGTQLMAELPLQSIKETTC